MFASTEQAGAFGSLSRRLLVQNRFRWLSYAISIITSRSIGFWRAGVTTPPLVGAAVSRETVSHARQDQIRTAILGDLEELRFDTTSISASLTRNTDAHCGAMLGGKWRSCSSARYTNSSESVRYSASRNA